MASSSPVLVIATDIPSGLRREGVYRGVLHETRDQPAMFAPVTKAAWTVGSADELADAVAEAARIAQAPNSGPVYLGIPTDFLKHPAAPTRELVEVLVLLRTETSTSSRWGPPRRCSPRPSGR